MPTATLVVLACMIGTGIFITTGTVLEISGNSLEVLLLWGLGGVVALTGSLCYAELATMWPHVGGEYIYLRNSFNLLPSFLTGWISLVVGFSASVAISAITFVEYMNQFVQSFLGPQAGISTFLSEPVAQKCLAAVVILIFGAIHIHGVKSGSRIQNALTIMKLVIIFLLIVLGFYFADWSRVDRLYASYPKQSAAGSQGLPGTGLVLLIIMFSYSGWSGASYIAGEMRNPGKYLPRALFLGTVITMVVYISLNVVFLLSSPGEMIMGQETVGAVAVRSLFGTRMSIFFTLAIALILLSSISVEMMIGPRVYYAMAKDKMIFQFLARINPRFRTPSLSILIQILLSILYVFIGNAKFLMEYMGFALGVFPILTVIGLIHMRIKKPDIVRPFKVPFYPVTPIVFITISTFMMVTSFMAWTSTSKFAIIIIILGIPVFYLWRLYMKKKPA